MTNSINKFKIDNNIAGVNASKLVIFDSDKNICQEIPVNNLTSYE